MGVDEWLMLCKKFKQLSDRFPESWTPDDDKEEEGQKEAESTPAAEPLLAEEEQDDGPGEDSGKHKKGKKRRRDGKAKGQRRRPVHADAADADEDEEDQEEWDVEDVVNVRIADNAKRGTQGTTFIKLQTDLTIIGTCVTFLYFFVVLHPSMLS